MASFRLLVLAFIRDYWARWGHSPSYGEIAAALDSNRTKTRRAVQNLVRDGLILRTPGPRGLRLPDQREAAIRVLSELGFAVAAPGAGDPTGAKSRPLPPPALDYCESQADHPISDQSGEQRE